MRTLALLAALLLLAIQAQAQSKHRMGQQDQNKHQPENKGQYKARPEDQDVVITLKEENRHSKGAAGLCPGYHRKKTCTCRQGQFCKVHENHLGNCKLYGATSNLCCH